MTIDITSTTRTRRLLDVSELQSYLKISRTVAYQLVSAGGGLHPYVVRIGRSIRVPHEAVDEWIDDRRGR